MAPKRTASSSRSDGESDTAKILEGLSEILGRLKSIEDKMDTVDERLVSLEKSFQFHSDTVDDLKNEVDEIKAVIPVLVDRTRDQEVTAANKALEIQGIPQNASENLIEIVKAVGNSVGSNITNDNIDSIYRNKRKAIVVRFIQTHVRGTFMANFKSNTKTVKLTADKLGYRSNTNQIYVNDYLLFGTRQIFYSARIFQKANDFKYAWTNNQKVFLRKSDSTNAVRIESEEDLETLKNSENA